MKICPLLPAVVILSGGLFATEIHAQTTLKDAFKNDFLIGTALKESQFDGDDPRETALIKAQFNSISPGNLLKWDTVHPGLKTYNFAPADQYVEFGVENHMFIVGHTLVWHNQTPKWVFQDANGNPVDRDTLLARMREHIFTVVGRYKGKIGGWDVVNEVLDEDGRLRQTPWLRIIGEDYIAKAFQFAHEADPNAQLYYNDYRLENVSKRLGAIALIKKLRAQGIPIAAVGLQGHYKLNWPSALEIDQTIETFSELKLKVNITEMDMDVLPPATNDKGADITMNFALQAKLNPYVNGLPDSVQQNLTERYGEVFSVLVKHHKDINRVTFWGVTDADSWLNDWPVRGRTAYPLLFDRNCQPKSAFDTVIQTAHSGQ
jgi:endo-1,4-beta-xylanase